MMLISLKVKALATEAKCTLFSLTAATLTSKYVGEGEKLVRTMFETARKKAPSIVFIGNFDTSKALREGWWAGQWADDKLVT